MFSPLCNCINSKHEYNALKDHIRLPAIPLLPKPINEQFDILKGVKGGESQLEGEYECKQSI